MNENYEIAEKSRVQRDGRLKKTKKANILMHNAEAFILSERKQMQ